MALDLAQKRRAIDPGLSGISVRRQCELLGLNRSSYYAEQALGQENETNLRLMECIDLQYTKTPFYGSRRMTAWLKASGHPVNRKRIQRLMRLMRIEGIGPKPGTSLRNLEHKIYPYLLRGLAIRYPNQVWSTDITYCPMPQGFMYLVAIIDWYSRYVVSWELSNSLDTEFCLNALNRALACGQPEIFNSDQGCQFTSRAFLAPLEAQQIKISMDGKGRALDNVFVERLWRSFKYECLYPNAFPTVRALRDGVRRYFAFYNHERPHQSLNYRSPGAVHFAGTRG